MYFLGSKFRTWLPWAALVLVVALVIAYIVTRWGGYRCNVEPFEAPADNDTHRCLTRPTLQRYENAATKLETALNTVVRMYDDYAKDKAAANKTSAADAGATGTDNTAAGAGETDPSILAKTGEDNDTNAMMTGKGGMGKGSSYEGLPSTAGSTPAMPSTSFEGFVADNACLHKPKDLKRATAQYKERPLALLKVYNELRTRVGKGIESIQRIHKKQNQGKVQEKEDTQKTKDIQQAVQVQKASLNNYYPD